MRAFSLFSTLLVSSITPHYATIASSTAIATFGSGSDPVVGYIRVSDGEVSVDLDFTNGVANYPGIFTEECFEGGLQYHIHTKYENLAEPSAIGTDCGGANLGGHFDPFLACGPATGNSLCEILGGCAERTYNCQFNLDPFSCEIGDWSLKYGFLQSNNNRYTARSSSFYEISPVDLVNRGVVIHCNDGTRVACARWEVTSGLETKPNQPTDKVAYVDFSDVLDSDSEIMLSPDGKYRIEFSFDDEEYQQLFQICAYAPVQYYIFEQWNSHQNSEYGNENCVYATGGATYDPTASCLPFSSKKDCQNDATCGVLAYACSESTGYSCSPSDLSGRLGSVSLGRRIKSFEVSGVDYFLPPIDDIIGRSIGVVCAENIVFCGEIKNNRDSDSKTSMSNNRDSDSSSGGQRH